MSNQKMTVKQSIANWLLNKGYIYMFRGIPCTIFIYSFFTAIAMFFVTLIQMNKFFFQLNIDGEYHYMGSLLLALSFMWFLAFLCSGLTSVILDRVLKKEIKDLCEKYPEKIYWAIAVEKTIH